MKVLSAPLSALALAVLLISAAPSQEGDKQKETKDSAYYPLKVGNRWTYMSSNGQKIVIRVAKKEKFGDVECARLEATVNGQTKDNELLAAKEDGIYRYAGNGMKLDPPVLVLKLPPKKGETWKVDSKFANAAVQGTFTIGEESVAVPAGKFKAVSVETKDMKIAGNPIETTLYFAPDVGMVRQTMNLGGLKVTLELEKFEAGP